MNESALRRVLTEGAAELQLTLPDPAVTTLLGYLRELARWNRAYNLSGVREPRAMVSRHLLDSLTLLDWLQGPRVLDLGSGAGLPGIPLAVVRPAVSFTLLDSSLKKTRFLENVVRSLGLANVQVVRARAEQWRPEAPFPTIVVRAVATAGKLARLAAPLLSEGGRLVLMKGADPQAELEDINAAFDIEAVRTVYVPHVSRERSLVVLRRTGTAD